MSNFSIKYREVLAALLIWIFLALNEIYWLKLDNFPLVWDSALHFVDSMQTFLILKNGFLAIPQIVHVNGYYPFLVPLMAAPFYALFGINPDIGIAGMNLIFLGVLILSTYGIGKKIMNERAGVLAAFIVSMYPMIFIYSRTFMYDVPLVAMSAFSLYLLLLTNNFRSKKFSVVLGFSFGLGMLTKWTFVLFIIGPLSYVLYDTVKSYQLDADFKPPMNFLIFVFLGFIVASSWYFPNIGVLKSLSVYVQQSVPTSSLPYVIALIDHMSLPLFILAIVMLGYQIKVKGLKSNTVVLLLWIIVPYLILSLQAHREPRYIAPVLPAFALISAIGIEMISVKKIKSSLIVLVIILCLAQFLSCSYGHGLKTWQDNSGMEIGPYHIEPIGTTVIYDYPYMHRLTTNNWKTDEILGAILNQSDRGYVSICLIPDNPMISSPLWYYSYLNKLNIDVTRAGLDPSTVLKTDYIMTYKIGTGYWGSEDVASNSTRAEKVFENNINNFTFVKRINLPDDSELLIYRNDKYIDSGWNAFENWGGTTTRWMSNAGTINVSSSENRTAKLSFRALSYNHNRSLEIFVNNLSVYLQNISPHFVEISTYIFLKDGENTVKFYVPEGCDRPCYTPPSSDCRCLSMAFQNMTII